ncbi:GNAT family N-acetyltransferase [Rhodopirellula bahusiensis]|uniref:Nourseothricin acetyltransferase n=1 Tax=Rhodopirellula bahusiensis TaxID=2014065 RepID=A0A2G1W177_9BACT|nr:GNAT family N-acetyltransferase [Rhodopirellula bahusiensis]PHQ32787.1 nourseothricin acetyltransferase [Rhodopirellula bahusiensis]
MMGNANQFGFDQAGNGTQAANPGDASEHEPLFRPFSLVELPALLPSALAQISPDRAVMVADQIRSAISRQVTDDLILLVSEASDAIAIVLGTPDSDMATVLHAGPIALAGEQPDWSNERESRNSQLADGLGRTLGQICRQRGIDFLQWATSWPPEHSESDPAASEDSSQEKTDSAKSMNSPSAWPEWMGFSKVGDLEYLALDLTDSNSFDSLDTPTKLHVHPVDVNDEEQMRMIRGLVQRTYHGSMDCPNLEQFRTAAQIMDGYQVVPTYAPDLWFMLSERPGDEPIGCLLMARHGGDSASVLEVVYMGVVPDARGRGFSRDILSLALRCCRDESASRMILAVDRTNRPARDAYLRLPMQTVLRESVWARNTTV